MKLNVNLDLSKVFNYLALVSYILKDDYLNYPDKTSKKFLRIEDMGHTLDDFIKKHEGIQKLIRPKIEATFKVKIKNPNLISIALFTPSTKNTFIAIGNYIQNNHPDLYHRDRFDLMAKFGDVAQGLATLGDAALKLAVTHILWNDGIIDKGKITKAKERIEQNSNLALYCDHLHLYENRVYVKSKYFDPKPRTIEHIKATLVEALLGIFYLEKGLQETLILIKSLEEQQREISKKQLQVSEF
jgi:ribonuclease-3